MILGANQMDGVILVVAMTEGPKQQTREHMILAKEIGIKYIVVYGNKIDAILDKELVFTVELEIREMLTNYGYDGFDVPLIFGSARNALHEEFETETGFKSIVNLMERVDNYIPQPERPINAPFLMPVEESLSITGRGTVLTGKVEKGLVKIGDELEIIGVKTYQTTCVGLEMYRKLLDMAQAGENVGILVRGIQKGIIRRGYVVAKPNSIKPVEIFWAKVYFLTKEEGGRKKPIYDNFKPQFYFRTSSITGSVTLDMNSLSEEQLLERQTPKSSLLPMALPGDHIRIKVQLIERVALDVGLRFAIREGTSTIGGGYIISLGSVLEEGSTSNVT